MNMVDFLNSTGTKPKLIAVVGPTGAGKTGLSLQVAKKFNGEIINADSKQLYKGLQISSGGISKAEMQGIPHHLFYYVDPSIAYTVEDHRRDALACIAEIHAKGKIPILVGGTGLFINALTENFDLPESSFDLKIRARLEEKNSDELWETLNTIDPAYAEITHKNNRIRVIRALELFEITGQKKSEMTKSESPFDCLILMPKIEDREVLYKRIDERAKQIWHSGLLTEAKALFDRKLDEILPAFKTIGIPEAFAFFRGEISEEEAISTMQQKSRNYAKRQMTWWRGDERVHEV